MTVDYERIWDPLFSPVYGRKPSPSRETLLVFASRNKAHSTNSTIVGKKVNPFARKCPQQFSVCFQTTTTPSLSFSSIGRPQEPTISNILGDSSDHTDSSSSFLANGEKSVFCSSTQCNQDRPITSSKQSLSITHHGSHTPSYKHRNHSIMIGLEAIRNISGHPVTPR